MARRDRRIILAQTLFECFERSVHVDRLVMHFGRTTPDHYQTAAAIPALKLLDVPHKALRQVHFGGAAFLIRPINPLHVILVEHRRHRLNLRKGLL